jgi:hypothetical protein
VDSTRSVQRSHDTVTAGQVRDARARAWAFVFDCYRKKEEASLPESRPDSDPDSEREKHRGGERCRSPTR